MQTLALSFCLACGLSSCSMVEQVAETVALAPVAAIGYAGAMTANEIQSHRRPPLPAANPAADRARWQRLLKAGLITQDNLDSLSRGQRDLAVFYPPSAPRTPCFLTP